MKRTLISMIVSELSIGRDEPLGFRWRLPGDDGQSGADAELIASVEQHGLIDPPILYSEPPVVVCGHRRIGAALRAGIEKVDAFMIARGAATKEEIASLWLEDVRYGAPLSDLERIVLSVKCRAFLRESFAASLGKLEAALGKTLSIDYLGATAQLLELPGEILDSLHEGRISTGDLLSLGAVDRETAARMLAESGLGRRDQREAVRMMLRLSDSGADVWKSFADEYEKHGGPLLEALRAAARPSIDGDLERIDGIVRAMGLPQGAAIRPPENLEGGSYRLSARMRDERSFSMLLDKLRAALDEGKMRQLLDILKGKPKK
jgi:ParB-like chromosome segregation protein Spo0J